MISDEKIPMIVSEIPPITDIPEDLVPDNYGCRVFYWSPDLFQIWNRK
jgi:hypothetical protein